ncbi:hypothetical protein ASPWEDRAFT_168733 [Aspergillus wentii DTO 134E9]|uniref:Uncharacterized protein n=1 Tax=Aspergillus wentii DTO 134E9 TaxID=1073089 RepID=A0A1L9RVA7_ASPWE|nr:uncharacterized protein ASPWEDRAFT_168733 [Aspergillus wentii DTO 134E9]KAI9928760.1 hypothetical protein MW887_001978 [Aspergillus wentii]OJJ38855.1 hypothetical protein ASPWEDRAFT_168733 [Aspergillus wentii DTO 134E9]
MGNICSRSKNEPDAFAQPGRVLGSASAPSASGQRANGPRAPLPAKANWGTPGRTLGDGPGGGGGGGGEDEARANAAIAAQKRAESNTAGRGKLGTKLAAQKAQTQTQTLDQVSREERAARDADGAATARRWD